MIIYKNMIFKNDGDANITFINSKGSLENGDGRLSNETFPKGQLELLDRIGDNDYYKCSSEVTSEEQQYLSLISKILSIDNIRPDRTLTSVKSFFGHQMRFSLRDGKIPVITTKYTNIDAVIVELIWFLSGDTNIKFLTDNNVHIWDGNSTREFLDKRGLNHLEEGNIGLGYGYQWRRYNSEIDQIKKIIEDIKTDPYSRRHILTAWNPADLDKMALPPCHCFAQFYIDNNELSCHLYQRSVDVFLGLPFNILSYSILTNLIAIYTGYKCGELIISTGDTHIYSNHFSQAQECLNRIPLSKPFFIFNKDKILQSNYLLNLPLDSISIKGYLYHPMIKAPMAV